MKHFVKPFSLLALLLTGISFLSSCGSGKKREVVKMFSSADTTTVLAMTDACMQQLANKQFNLAFSNLFNISSDDLVRIDETQQMTLAEHFSAFPVLSYKMTSMEFKDVYNVTIIYTYEFFEKPKGDNLPNTMTVTFAPQRLGTRWYLALQKKSEM